MDRRSRLNGFGSTLFCATKRLMAALRSSTDRKKPRIRRRRVSLAKKLSTALSQDAEVGVTNSGAGSSHAQLMSVAAPVAELLSGLGRQCFDDCYIWQQIRRRTIPLF